MQDVKVQIKQTRRVGKKAKLSINMRTNGDTSLNQIIHNISAPYVRNK